MPASDATADKEQSVDGGSTKGLTWTIYPIVAIMGLVQNQPGRIKATGAKVWV